MLGMIGGEGQRSRMENDSADQTLDTDRVISPIIYTLLIYNTMHVLLYNYIYVLLL